MNLKEFEHLTPEAASYVPLYFPESRRFLYSGFYAQRKRRMKFALRVTAFENNLVYNDILITLTNAKKSFFEANTALIHYRYKKTKDHPLIASARIKRGILFQNNEMLYHTHRFLDFRNITFRMYNDNYKMIGFNNYARPINKLMFFNLFLKLTNFSLRAPYLIFNKYRKCKYVQAYQLGFKFFFRKKRLPNIIQKSSFFKHPYKRLRTSYVKLYFPRRRKVITKFYKHRFFSYSRYRLAKKIDSFFFNVNYTNRHQIKYKNVYKKIFKHYKKMLFNRRKIYRMKWSRKYRKYKRFNSRFRAQPRSKIILAYREENS